MISIAYKTRPNISGNCKRLVVIHDTKMYALGEYWSDIDLVVTAKELKELITILNREGYTRLEGAW